MLKNEIEVAKRSVSTDSVQISIGEISTMYKNEEIDIIPEFQRLFRWSIEKKSNFIESILIGIPVPPLFAFEKKDGTWELIDGLQRVSTIMEFMGVLRNVDDPDSLIHSKLVQTKYLPSLDNTVWDAGREDGSAELDQSLKLFFRRSRLDFQVLKHPSDPKTKFDLFQRLNRGGTYANEQEVRTCSMVLANRDFTRRIRNIAESDDFSTIFRLTNEQIKNQHHVEYCVRIIAHTLFDFGKGEDVGEFLDRRILDVLIEGRDEPILGNVEWMANTLARLFGDEALIADQATEGIAARFSLRALEAIFVGLMRNIQSIRALPNPDSFIRDRVSRFWEQPQVREMSASGLRGGTRLQRTVPFGANWFDPNANC